MSLLIDRVEFANKKLARVTMIYSLVFEVNKYTGLYNFILTLGNSEEGDKEENITIKFNNIEDLDLNLDMGGWAQLMMLRIDFQDNGLERRYVVLEHEHGSLKFKCSDFEI